MKSIRRFALVPFFAFLTAESRLHAELDQDAQVQGVQENADAFQTLEAPAEGSVVSFEITLGETVARMGRSEVFDGFRFIMPDGAAGKDFVWFFNAPEAWGHWYVCPASGPFQPAFREWLNGDKNYERFDRPGEKERLRVLQTLEGSYFKPGEEYIFWFHRVAGQETGQLRGVFAFATPPGKWDHEAIESALSLKPQGAAAQVGHLNSRGGRILLDETFFEPSYARNRIDDVFESLRQTTQFQSGFFITMEFHVPPCTTEPSLAAIRQKYGEPDFVLTGEEARRLRDGKDASEGDVVRSYYDYFSFEVATGDRTEKVLRVSTQATDFSTLRDGASEDSFGRAPLKNLVVFHHGTTEVGRMYYFLEGGKEPVVIAEPPAGTYRRKGEELQYEGAGEWIWRSLRSDGSAERISPLRNHRIEGEVEGFHENGKISFRAPYSEGEVDGEVVVYSPEGAVVERQKFRRGKREKDAEPANGGR